MKGLFVLVLVLALGSLACSLTAQPTPTPTPPARAEARATVAIGIELDSLNVAMVASPTPDVCTVATGQPGGWLHVRSGRGVTWPAIAQIREGSPVTVIERGESEWVRVNADGVSGYINATFCK